MEILTDWLPVHRDQLRAQRSVTSMGKLYLFLLTADKKTKYGDFLRQIVALTILQ